MRTTRAFRQQLRDARRLAWLAIRLTWSASPSLVLGILSLLAMQALLRPLQLMLSKAVLDRLALDLGLVPISGGIVAWFPLLAWMALTAAILGLTQLLQPVILTLQSVAGDRLSGYVTEQLIRAANRWQGLARFEDPSFADDLERARSHAGRAGLLLLVHGGLTGLSLFTAVGLVVVLLSLHPLTPFMLLAASLPHLARHWEYGFRSMGHLYRQTPETRRLQYSRDLLLTPEPAKDVRLYGLGPFFRQLYEAIFDRTTGVLYHLRRQLIVKVALAGVLGGAAAGAVYIYVVWLIVQGEKTLGDLVLYGGAATMLQINLLSLANDIGNLPEELGFLPSLSRVLEAEPDLPLPTRPARPVPQPVRQGIVFEHVAFHYPSSSNPVLGDVSFRIRPGECLALVGRNGAGKTTIVKLLLRLYDPTAGRILLDGIDLREYRLDALRQHMGAVFQDFVRYELTARENIGLGQIEMLSDDSRLQGAATKAGVDGFLQQLANGLDTQLGRQFGGRELSGGEWQKLALARAFLRDSQLLMLDEPTAALDVETEHELYTRFHQLTRDRMTLLISHRFSTVRMANRILFLSEGVVQEEGSHTDLMTRDGEYARLYRLQAKQYQAANTGEGDV
ncbi:MAG: ABC transporter ATP-binding protein [Dehalococcoidia bacterium]|nr:ABC transporter ATP-binding protein [Dehalococcoidia bacterium]